MDWLKKGKQLNHFQYPPSTPTDEELEVFVDGLKEIILVKIEELLNRLDQLKEEKELKLKAIQQKIKQGSLEEWFSTLYVEHVFLESTVIKKWLKYWLTLEKKVNKKKSEPENPSKEKLDVEKARQYPVENLYEGQLRRAGSRLAGLCPFHEEKTPSFFIFPDDNHYHCYGCGQHGNAISFVMQLKGLGFQEAVRFLQ